MPVYPIASLDAPFLADPKPADWYFAGNGYYVSDGFALQSSGAGALIYSDAARYTFDIGSRLTVRIRPTDSADSGQGQGVSFGIIDPSNYVEILMRLQQNNTVIAFDGTLRSAPSPLPGYFRIERDTATTWAGYVSVDGVTFTKHGASVPFQLTAPAGGAVLIVRCDYGTVTVSDMIGSDAPPVPDDVVVTTGTVTETDTAEPVTWTVEVPSGPQTVYATAQPTYETDFVESVTWTVSPAPPTPEVPTVPGQTGSAWDVPGFTAQNPFYPLLVPVPPPLPTGVRRVTLSETYVGAKGRANGMVVLSPLTQRVTVADVEVILQPVRKLLRHGVLAIEILVPPVGTIVWEVREAVGPQRISYYVAVPADAVSQQLSDLTRVDSHGLAVT